MAHEPDSCYSCEHGEPCPEIGAAVEERDYRWVAGGIPAIYNDDWYSGCMCDFEGHTRTGCTHDS